MPERHSWRTFLDEAFILNAKSSWRTLPTQVPDVIHSRGSKSLCDVPVTCPSVLIQEFYSNMHGFDYSVPHFITRIWGKRIVITSQIVADVLYVPRVEFPDYPGCERLRTVSKNELKSAFCERLSDWGVSVSSLTIQALQKALSFLTWSWHLFFTLFLTIILSQSLVLDFCCPFLSILL